MDTLALALFLLRADTSADSGQGRRLFDDRSGTEHIARLQFLNETRDVDIDRTALYAGRVLTVQTPVRFVDGLLKGEPLVHLFVQTLHAHFGTQFRHLHALNRHTVLRRALKGSNRRKTGFACKTAVAAGPLRCKTGFACKIFMSIVLIFLQRFRFFGAIRFHAAQHLVPIDTVRIELRTIDADELGLAVHGHTARAAHTRSVHHDGVETRFGGDVIFGGSQCHELHHDRRTDGDTLIDLLAVDDLLHADRDDSFLSDRTVVGHEDDLIGPLCQFVL